MATGSVLVNVGSGVAMRTYDRSDGGTVKEWLQSISEPITETYTICPTAAVSTATANSHLLQIMAGASKAVVLRALLVTQLAAAGSATVGQFELRRLTSAGTGGTAVTAGSTDPGDASAGAAAMTLPSSKGTEGGLLWIQGGILLATVAVAGAGPVLSYPTFDLLRGKPIRIAAGTSNGVALKIVTAIASGTVLITAVVSELSWA